ncbi:CGNR zinc finger domain-containing protein [Actinophytocola oryzae]|uniref:Putative RNA-binding Zn ribbon-like protein n=1 Tax=Actinophytocola oryzae TaxID=502181 RepID=A0A4R7UT53_9PSEU|nr:CGNR zinc finger domain-containing protein [Actinophytocola oryzae]TDV39818.1 putative RNA-binding Zn ribbon-like protein [Actinophytocola oryzae]
MVSEKVPPFAVSVGGTLLPKPISGHPALELCNTLAGWNEPPEHRREWLTTPEVLATWVELTGLGPCPPVGHAVLDELRELRELAYRVLQYRDHTAFPRLAELAEEANAQTRLTPTSGFRLPPGDDPRRPVLAAALTVADLLARPERDAVRACPGEGCGWLFVDVRGRRTWCSMAACGNRVKVRAHAARRRADRRP